MRSFSRFVAKCTLALSALALPASAAVYQAQIEVNKASDNSSLGFVAADLVGSGQGAITTTAASAMTVQFTLPDGATTGTGINLAQQNANPSTFPYLGLIQGRDDVDSTLQSGSYQYGYIATTNATPAGSTPQIVGNSYTTGSPRTSESAVWSIDLITDNLSPVWTNPDSSDPSLDLFSQTNALYIGGDQAAFLVRYPAPVTAYTLELVNVTPVVTAVPLPASAWAGLLAAATAFVVRRKLILA